MYYVVFSDDAENELDAILRHYTETSPYIIPKLEKEIDRIIDQLEIFPHSYQVFASSFRRAHLHVFPYTFYYNVEHHDITIFAILPQQILPESILERVFGYKP